MNQIIVPHSTSRLRFTRPAFGRSTARTRLHQDVATSLDALEKLLSGPWAPAQARNARQKIEAAERAKSGPANLMALLEPKHLSRLAEVAETGVQAAILTKCVSDQLQAIQGAYAQLDRQDREKISPSNYTPLPARPFHFPRLEEIDQVIADVLEVSCVTAAAGVLNYTDIIEALRDDKSMAASTSKKKQSESQSPEEMVRAHWRSKGRNFKRLAHLIEYREAVRRRDKILHVCEQASQDFDSTVSSLAAAIRRADEDPIIAQAEAARGAQDELRQIVGAALKDTAKKFENKGGITMQEYIQTNNLMPAFYAVNQLTNKKLSALGLQQAEILRRSSIQYYLFLKAYLGKGITDPQSIFAFLVDDAGGVDEVEQYLVQRAVETHLIRTKLPLKA